MSVFNYAYNLGNFRRKQPEINKDATISIEIAHRSNFEEVCLWGKWMVSKPLTLAHKAYTTYLMIKNKDLLKSIKWQIYPGNRINYMPTSKTSFHIISDPKIIATIAQHYRNDPEGVFQKNIDANTFSLLLRDLFPKQTEPFSDSELREQFLLTCSKENTAKFRHSFFCLVGPAEISRLKPELNKVIKEILEWLAQRESEGSVQISASALSELITVATLSRLFLGYSGSIEECRQIGKAVSFALNFRLMKNGAPSEEQQKQYQWALQTLRSAIELSEGAFTQHLKESHFSEIERLSMLFLTYLAGSETTSLMMQYVLWRLGQQPECQEQMFGEAKTTDLEQPKAIVHFLNECLRFYTPAYVFTRYARENLDIKIGNNPNGDWTYRIWKNEGIICSPFLAGQDDKKRGNPKDFRPEKASSHPSIIFNSGRHNCPGQWLAKAEIIDFVSQTLQNYTITSSPEKEELAMTGLMTLKVEDVQLTFTRRQEMSDLKDQKIDKNR